MKFENSREIAIVIIPKNNFTRFEKMLNHISCHKYEIRYAETKEDLENIFQTGSKVSLLFTFGTSIIVPEEYLNKQGILSINIHAASPEFPGRDPHHFAIYDSAKVYGATMHHMTKKVDDGPIIDVELFTVTKDYTPIELLAKADECGWILAERLFNWLNTNKTIPVSEHKWTGKKRTRTDFRNLCKIECNIDKDELERRIKAFHVEPYSNLYIKLHGQCFFYHK